MEFREGVRYRVELHSGDVFVGTYIGEYEAGAPASSILLDAGDDQVPVMRATIRTAEPVADGGRKSLEAVRVRFSCGHEGGVWPEEAAPGTPHHCLQCTKVVEVVETPENIVPFGRPGVSE